MTVNMSGKLNYYRRLEWRRVGLIHALELVRIHAFEALDHTKEGDPDEAKYLEMQSLLQDWIDVIRDKQVLLEKQILSQTQEESEGEVKRNE